MEEFFESAPVKAGLFLILLIVFIEEKTDELFTEALSFCSIVV